MEKVHSELLQQFSQRGYSIEGGVAIDVRLVKSSSGRRAMRKSRQSSKNERQPKESGPQGEAAEVQK